ncbi:hypothetical protein SAMD00019534_106390 [Acytostelium subglobosum LB1]|uniref:hypothetical protein n=1 Tax=Acytostelium subglobosum LB1 TaxID=1410327 RepID=UPI0006449D9F|nr:hypothetical protein SAMD00019534_106390 [Acytostelium subglobosum LB1]GAM27463.1 hypothetical protein SAMD00019534_106390 [Acytostelium subglobosum LB1]|eukprot:XP_012749528.1 hypothetical protein SAMD00019534_106390 [Acytostelium subglobosum LB1]
MGQTDSKPNTLGGLPSSMTIPENTETLEISEKHLVSFPAELSQLRRLVTLSLAHNNIQRLDGIAGLVTLEDLDLSYNSLQQLTDELFMVVQLNKLNISFNQLQALPPAINMLKLLRTLNLMNNQLTALPKEIGQTISLQTMNISFNKIVLIPKEMGSLINLTKLILNNNKINQIPPEIGKLQQLTLLDLAENELRQLPREIGQLKTLTKLYLDNNDFLELTSEVGNLAQLKELNLRCNQLVDLPSSMHKLQKLTLIDLEDNQWENNNYQSHDIEKLLAYLKTKRDVVNKSRKSTSKEYRRTLERNKVEEKKRLSVNTIFETMFTFVENTRSLYLLKGKHRIMVRRVDFLATNLNNSDSFILDTGKKLFVFLGATSNSRERQKAVHFAGLMRIEQGGNSDVVVLDNKTRKEDQSEFWKEFGGKQTVSNGFDNDADAEEEMIMIMKLFKFTEAEGGRIDIQVFAGEDFFKSMLDSSSCVILDTGSDIYVWSGTYSSSNEKSWSMLKAEELMEHSKRPSSSEIKWVMEGVETLMFKENFVDWIDNSWDVSFTRQKDLDNEREEMLKAEAEKEQRRMEKEEREMAEQELREQQKQQQQKQQQQVPSPSVPRKDQTPIVTTTPPPQQASSPQTEKSEREKAKEREKEKIRERLKLRELSSGKLDGSATPPSAPTSPSTATSPATKDPVVPTTAQPPKSITISTTPTPTASISIPKTTPSVEPPKATPAKVTPTTTPTPATTTTSVQPKPAAAITVPTTATPSKTPTTTPTATATQPATKEPVKTPAVSVGPSELPEQSVNLLAPLPEKVEASKARKPATRNPIRARQERAAAEEEAAKLRLLENPTPAKPKPTGGNTGFGLLHSLGADEGLFKQRREQMDTNNNQGGVAALINMQPKDQPKLLHVKGRRSPFVRQVDLTYLSLNKGDVFILDCGKEKNLIYQWNGSESNRIEKGKGMDIAKSIKDKERVGCRVIILEEGKENDDFWTVLGGQGPISEADTAGDDREAELNIRKHINLYQVVSSDLTQFDLLPLDGRLSKTMLQAGECYILDCVSEIFVWTGSASKLKMRNTALKMGSDMLESRRGSVWVAHCHREFPGSEQVLFKERFPDWGGSLPIMVQATPVGLNTASAKAQAKIDVNSMLTPKPEKEEVMIDDGNGKITVWRVEEFTKIALDPQRIGHFYSGDSYVILYSYIYKNKDCYLIYFWQGKNSSINEKGTSALLTMELDDSLKGMAKEVRVVQNKEPKHFLSVFKNKIIVHQGKDPAAKGYKAPDPEAFALYHVRGTTEQNIRAIQTITSAQSLSTYGSYLLVNNGSSVAYIWYGRLSNEKERAFSKNIINVQWRPQPGKIVEMEEGKETADFWKAIGGKDIHPMAGLAKRTEPRLFSCSIGSGIFVVEEIHSFAQDDLLLEDVYIIDGIEHIWVWIGTGTTEVERKMSMELSLEYSAALEKHDGRKNIPCYITYSGQEPFIFTALFHGWDFAKRREKLSFDKDIVPVTDILQLYTKKYTYDEIVNKQYPKGLDGSRLEEYLSDEEFYEVLKMTLDEFKKLPLWRKQSLKKELQLY